MTYKIAQQTKSMSTFRNLVWHEFEIFTRMPGPRFKSYNVHRIETSILSLVLCTFKCCFQPPPPAHTLHTSCIGQSSSPNHLRKLSVSDTRSFFTSMFRSLTLSTTQPPFFHSVTKCIYLTHPPLHPMPSSLSPSPSHPLALNTCIAYLAPQPLVRTHARCLSRSLPQDCLTLSSARRATLAKSRSLYLSLI